jgi:glycerate dehydrogenase
VTKRIVFLDRGTIGPGVRIPTPKFEHSWVDHARSEPSQVLERLKNADIAITNKAPITASTIAQLPTLKMIAVAATGANIVDLDACKKRGIIVSNIRGYAQRTVPEHAFSMILGLRRNLFEYREQVNQGAWQASKQFCFFNRPTHDLHGATLGIIGTGSIACGVGQIGKGFGMTVLYHSLSGRGDFPHNLVDLETLLSTSNVVSIHCPLTDQSEHLINQQTLSLMRSDALLINTARGQIVDIDALAKALNGGEIAGAGIDVLDQEPPAVDSIIMSLSKLPNCLVTPHIAWGSIEAMQTLCDQLIVNIEAFVAGEPVNGL